MAGVFERDEQGVYNCVEGCKYSGNGRLNFVNHLNRCKAAAHLIVEQEKADAEMEDQPDVGGSGTIPATHPYPSPPSLFPPIPANGFVTALQAHNTVGRISAVLDNPIPVPDPALPLPTLSISVPPIPASPIPECPAPVHPLLILPSTLSSTEQDTSPDSTQISYTSHGVERLQDRDGSGERELEKALEAVGGEDTIEEGDAARNIVMTEEMCGECTAV